MVLNPYIRSSKEEFIKNVVFVNNFYDDVSEFWSFPDLYGKLSNIQK